MSFSLYAGEITYTVNFSEGDLSFHKYNNYDIILLKGCESTNEFGKPMLPEYIVNILVPPNSEISDDGRLVYTVEQDGINDALKADGLQSVPMLSEESTLYAICWYLFMD